MKEARIVGEIGARAATIVVDGSETDLRLLREILAEERCRLLEARDGGEVFQWLERGGVDLVILPAQTPEGLARCRQIRADGRSGLVPVLMLTGENNVVQEIEALGAGASDCLGEPFRPEVARARIRALLRHKAATDQLEQTETILFALAQAVEQRDPFTGGHCERLALFSLALGVALGLAREELVALHRGGYLHDIGKVGMPDSVLFKSGPLDEGEWSAMRTHPARGEEICRPLRSLAAVLPIIRSHHEKWDGTGYPDGLRGAQIPLLARVLQLADIYDALTSVRPYKPALAPDKALQIMREEADRGWRDPELMELFLRLASGEESQAWREAEAMQTSLGNLQAHLAAA